MSILEHVSPQWMEGQYQLFKTDPQLLSEEWRSFFQGYELGLEAAPTASADPKSEAVQGMIHRYRDLGYVYACVDPLSPCELDHPLFSLDAFGLEESDLERSFAPTDFILKKAPLKEIIAVLKHTYCRSLGIEYMHIALQEERLWLQQRAEETRTHGEFSHNKKLRIFALLLRATKFENFLHRKFVGQKRFSLEGGEAVIPLLDHIIENATQHAIKDVVIGMSHRGRLNVLFNIFRKPVENIFAEFADNERYQIVGEGDVKYHKGYSNDRVFADGSSVHISLASNPSHLEAVDPVVEGKCRARQDRFEDDGAAQIMPLLIHGDAAFAGQGIIAETLNLSQLAGYKTGGTLHIVINNQIGFTTAPIDARSTEFPTDIAKMLMVPIFHVNGDDPEALLQAASLALEYRQRYAKDVVIEVVCYRRHGHNEGDEPFFTQPLMYEIISNHPLSSDIYRTQLLEEGFAEENLDRIATAIETNLESALQREVCPLQEIFLKQWNKIERNFSFNPVETGVEQATLNNLNEQLTQIPQDFSPHRKIATLMEKRRAAFAESTIDWGTGEALAFASLVHEGTSIRLSGQDSRRGTFNHRHATLYDGKTGAEYTPLQQIAAQAGSRFDVFNSMLSEAAVLGFDYGYSVETPFDLTIWEAQFGDFANGAQVIIDQFIASSLAKWGRPTGLTMFLPHGYEGQGPEHSSARIERYLQLCADANMLAVNPSTPAQLFHLLRRQLRAPYRRPLVVFTPKALLRHPACVSTVEELTSGRFQEIIGDELPPQQCSRVIFCSGKIYYELLQQRSELKREDVALIRIEQLYPLHRELLEKILAPYPTPVEYSWVQEEIGNAGGWDHLRPQLRELLGIEPRYIGRKRSASTAVGSHRIHKSEQQQILEQAFAPF
jgi:2-oxoglutarate dehydrogenase E1 component